MVKWFVISPKLLVLLLFHLSLISIRAQKNSKQQIENCALDDKTNVPESNLYDDEFVSTKHFIDKSDLFQVLFKDGPKRHFITCPAGFGKTLNLHMIRQFCQLELDENNGTLIPWKESKAYALFNRTKIIQNQNISESHIAQHPVIYLDFNCSFIPRTDKMIEYTMAEMNRQLFSNFKRYLTCIERYYTPERRQNLSRDFQSWLNSSISHTMGDNFKTNINNILQTFSMVFDSDIILLIDNHDYHVNPKFKNIQRRTESAQKLLHDVLIDIVKTYKHRLYLLITGISSISFYRYKLNEFVEHFNFIDDIVYVPYFGLLELEMQELFKRYNTQESEQSYVRKFYNSYKTTIHRYNTFHVINYFANRIKQTSSSVTLCQTKNRLSKSTDFIKLFLKHPDYLEDVAKLLKHCSIADSFNKTYNVGDLRRFDDLSRKDFDTIRSQDIKFLYTMSFEHGFISRAKDGTYIIPNYETRRLFEADLRHYFETTLHINVTQIGIEFLDILYKTANKTGDVSNQLKLLMGPAFQKLQPIIGLGSNRIMNFTFHLILHIAALTNRELTLVDDYPQPLSHHQSDSNFDRRCVTLITGVGVAVIFKITLDRSAKIAMEQAMTYAYQNSHIKYLKYVGMNIDHYGFLEVDHCPKSYFLQKGETPMSEELDKFTINFEDIFMKQEQELQQQQQQQQQQQELRDDV